MKKITTVILALVLSFSSLAFAGNYSSNLCSNYKYKCIQIKRGQTWDSLFPNSDEQDIVRRINRNNAELIPGMAIAVPRDFRNANLLDFSPFPSRIIPSGRTVVIVDMSEQAFAAYDAFGILVHWGPVSGGKGWCPDINKGCHSPFGNFHVFNKGGPDCISSKFPVPTGGAPMPYCMHFYGGFALHAGTLPGYHASHGCIRLFYDDALWLNKEFVSIGPKSTQVIIQP
jgi:L,D-transpeptidase ErfK/SrfK